MENGSAESNGLLAPDTTIVPLTVDDMTTMSSNKFKVKSSVNAPNSFKTTKTNMKKQMYVDNASNHTSRNGVSTQPYKNESSHTDWWKE